MLLARVGRKKVAVPQGSHSSLQNENVSKILSLLENIFVGSDEGNPAQFIDFLDQIKTDVISSNNLNAESIAKQISASVNTFNTQSSIIKKKDQEIADLKDKLRKSEEKKIDNY